MTKKTEKEGVPKRDAPGKPKRDASGKGKRTNVGRGGCWPPRKTGKQPK